MDSQVRRVHQSRLNIRGLWVVLSAIAGKDDLEIHLQEMESGFLWKGKFLASFVEEISRKSGHFQKFSMFVKMLVSGIKKTNDCVELDLFNQEDLHDLKTPTNLSEIEHQNAGSPEKRFLIVTHFIGFDRVHYPLPLSFQPLTPDPHREASVDKKEPAGKRVEFSFNNGVHLGSPETSSSQNTQIIDVTRELFQMEQEIKEIRATHNAEIKTRERRQAELLAENEQLKARLQVATERNFRMKEELEIFTRNRQPKRSQRSRASPLRKGNRRERVSTPSSRCQARRSCTASPSYAALTTSAESKRFPQAGASWRNMKKPNRVSSRPMIQSRMETMDYTGSDSESEEEAAKAIFPPEKRKKPTEEQVVQSLNTMRRSWTRDRHN